MSFVSVIWTMSGYDRYVWEELDLLIKADA